MTTTRRDFLQRSATAAAAASLLPLGREANAESPEAGRATALDDRVKAFEDRMLRARPVPLSHVRLLGGPLKRAQELTQKYLLELEPDRMMAYYRQRAGLPEKAKPYDGWDGGGRNLTGHIAGHHLSAVSLMFVATGDARFKARAEYLVKELKAVQDKNGDGYLGALEGGREALAAVSRGEIRSTGFDLNGLWSPWYTLHKTFAGLRDAFRYSGNRGALEMETKYAMWAEGVLAPMSDSQVQRMLNTEHGGMNEVLADLYADTGDARWLKLSYRFEHRAFTDALKRHQDNLNGKHGNCQIPKLIGSAKRYGYTADAADIQAASFFYDRVALHHSYATGGHGLAEYFGPPDQLSARVDGRTCETCNCYNMLKLTRRLFAFRPDAYYADFHERTLFNHILASIDPEDGRTSYMVPVGRSVQQEYQHMLQDFTCCVGTGMESHALHGDGLYFESADTLWVSLFVPSSAHFPGSGVDLRMETGFPEGDTARIVLTMPASRDFTLAVRRPAWAGDRFAIRVNGSAVEVPLLASLRANGAGGRNVATEDTSGTAGSYVELRRTWKSGDVVDLAIPKSLHLEPTADNKSVTAILWGPLVLAGDHGPRREGRTAFAEARVPVLVAGERPVAEWVLPGAAPGDFHTAAVARVPGETATATELQLTPFYRTHRRNYSTYFDVVTPAEFGARTSGIAAERARASRLEAATVGVVQLGDPQQEREAAYLSDPVDRPLQRTNGRSGRGGAGSFTLGFPVDATTDMAVVVTYFNEVGLPPTTGNFSILVDGLSVGTFEPNPVRSGFYDAVYAVPSSVVLGKSRVTVRFDAGPTGRIAPVFGVRMVRANAM